MCLFLGESENGFVISDKVEHVRCRTFFEFPVPCYSLEEKNRLPDTLFANPNPRPKKTLGSRL